MTWFPIYCEACGGRIGFSLHATIRDSYCTQCIDLFLYDELGLIADFRSTSFVRSLRQELGVVKSVYGISQDAMIDRTSCQKFLDNAPGDVVKFLEADVMKSDE